MALQMSRYDGKRKAWNWEKYVAQHVKYHTILGNLMEYGYQGLDPRLKVWYLLIGIRCDKSSILVATVRVHWVKYKKDFDAGVAFFTQYIDNRALTLSVKVVSVSQTRPAKQQMTSTSHGTFKGKGWVEEVIPERNMTQCQQYSSKSYMTSGRKLDLLRVRRHQKTAELYRLEWLH